MMRGADKDDGVITGDVKSAARAYLSEEYLGYDPPEHESCFISDFRHFGKCRTRVLCEKVHEEERRHEFGTLKIVFESTRTNSTAHHSASCALLLLLLLSFHVVHIVQDVRRSEIMKM